MSWTATQFDWSDAKLVAAISYPSTWIAAESAVAKEKLLGMVESFNPRVSTPYDIIDSINNHNQGTVKKQARFTIDIVTMPYGEGFELLQMCQNGSRYFDIVLAPVGNFEDNPISESENVGQPDNTWATELAIFKGCKVIDKGERYAIGAKPTVTFSCIAMRYVGNKLSTEKKIEIGTGFSGPNATDVSLGVNELS